MIHLRIVAPPELAKQVLDLLCSRPSVLNVVHLAWGCAQAGR